MKMCAKKVVLIFDHFILVQLANYQKMRKENRISET